MERDLQDKLGCGCPYCGVPMDKREFRPSRDHMQPRSRGGFLDRRNTAIVCAPCNRDKNDLNLQEFYAALVRLGDPRVGHVKRLIEGMSLFVQGKLRIPQVPAATRRTYPKLQGRLERRDGGHRKAPKSELFYELLGKTGCGCPYCGVTMGHKTFKPKVDFMVPLSRGGTPATANRVIVCEPCADSKGGLTLQEFHQALGEDDDPRALQVARLLADPAAYAERRLTIAPVSREERLSYPNFAYSLGPAEDAEPEAAPAMGM